MDYISRDEEATFMWKKYKEIIITIVLQSFIKQKSFHVFR
jgi:hypothetical protein